MGSDLTGRKMPTKFYRLNWADLAEGRSIRRGWNELPEANASWVSVPRCVSQTVQMIIWTSLQLFSTSPAEHPWCERGARVSQGGAAGPGALPAHGRGERCAPAAARPWGQRSPAVLSGAWYTAGKLEGSMHSQRGAGDNARNGPLLGVRQARS